MSQAEIEQFLKRHAPDAFTADEINNYLKLGGNTVYSNLRKMRPKCEECHSEITGAETICPWNACVRKVTNGLRAEKRPHRSDARRHTFFYYFVGENGG